MFTYPNNETSSSICVEGSDVITVGNVGDNKRKDVQSEIDKDEAETNFLK